MRHHDRPHLPAIAHYGKLPIQFNQALQRADERARSGDFDPDGVRRLESLYQANRIYAEARACFRVIADSPGGLSARDHYHLAGMALDEGDLAGAQAELSAVVQAEPHYVPARLTLAEAFFKSGQVEDAERQYRAVLATETNNPQASLGMARIELQRGNDLAAVARLRDLVARHPESTSGAALLAQVLDRRGMAEEAAAMRALSRQAHEAVPPDPWMKAMLTDCYDLQRLGIAFEEYRLAGQMDQALPLLDRLEELDPTGWMPPMLRGWSQKEAGHFPEAVEQYRLALKDGGDPERICPLLVAALLTEGHAGEAAALLALYHQKLPHSIPILLSYCEVAVRLEDEKLARSLLGEVLREDPNLYMPNMSMIQILWNSGDHDAALPYLQRVAGVFPSDVDSRGLLGQYYMEKSDPWSAIAPLEQATLHAQAENPKRDRLLKMLDTAYLTAGAMEASRGHFAAAVGFSERAIRLFPGAFRGYALKANACRRMKDFKGAADALGKMSSLEPGESSIELSLGDVIFSDGDGSRAREHWQRALQLAPADAAALRSALAQRLSGKIPAEVPGESP